MGMIPLTIGSVSLSDRKENRQATAICAGLGIVGAALVATAALWFLREAKRWEWAFLLLSWGQNLLTVNLMLAAAFGSGDTWFVWYVANILLGTLIAAGVLVALTACGIDFFSRQPRDAFHWIGAATLAIVIAHPIAAHLFYCYLSGHPVWLVV
jgi:hypothetical protein